MMTFTQPSRRAESRLKQIAADHWLVTGHKDGVTFGQDGKGREYLGPLAEKRALRAALELAYGESMPELGALADGWETTALHKAIDGALYTIQQVGDKSWDLKRYSRAHGTTAITTADDDGEPKDWSTLAEAVEAAKLHAGYVRAGTDPVFAVLEVQREMREVRAA